MILWNNGLINAVVGSPYAQSRSDPSWWRRLIENAVGAHLLNHLAGLPWSIYYWLQRHLEVDFVLETPRKIWPIEVKSVKPERLNGLKKFCELYPEAQPLIIGPRGMEFEKFFRANPKDIF